MNTIKSFVAAALALSFYSAPARAEWVTPLALALFRKIRGRTNFAPSAKEFAAKHGGVYARLTGCTLDEGFNFVYQLVLTWADAGIISIDAAGDMVLLGKYADEAMAPVRPMLTEPSFHDGEFGGQGTRALASGRPHRFVSDEQKEALDAIQGTAYAVNARVLAFANAMADEGAFEDGQQVMERNALAFANDNLADGQSYWLPCFLDWRGRIYTDCGAILSYQGGDLHRALCWYADAKAIDVNSDAWAQFLVSIAAEYGVTMDNYRDVLSGNVHGSKPLCVYAAAVAIDEVVTTGKTAYIWQQDATCSGMGHMACIMRDGELARRTALLGPISKSEDLYTMTASFAIENDRFFTYREEAADLSIVDLLTDSSVRSELGNRTCAKKPVMIIAYGSSVTGIAQGWCTDAGVDFDVVAERWEGEEADLNQVQLLSLVEWSDVVMTRELPFTITVEAAKAAGIKPGVLMLCLANAYSRSLQEQFPSIAKFISHMKRIAVRTYKATGFAAGWRSSAGMVCFAQPTQPLGERSVSLTVNKRRVVVNVPALEATDGQAGQSPNRIHSEDASVVIKSVNDCATSGVAISPIHDSWGSHIADGLVVRQAVRDAMVDIHSGYLFDAEESACGIKSQLPRGDWDINAMVPSMIG